MFLSHVPAGFLSVFGLGNWKYDILPWVFPAFQFPRQQIALQLGIFAHHKLQFPTEMTQKQKRNHEKQQTSF